MPSVYIKTYGCQMNERDSEAVAAQLVAKGYTLARSEATADVILLNTCSVRDAAEQKALGKMQNLAADVRRHRPNVVLGFLGCMAQSRGQELIDRLPDVDLVLGTQKFHRAAEYLEAILSGRRDKVCDVGEEVGSEATIKEHLLSGNPGIDDSPRANEKAGVGSTGYQPVPSGDSPDGMERASKASPEFGNPLGCTPTPVGESPTGAGESPAPPIFQTRSREGSLQATAFVSIMQGCNQYCTFCIVPYTRGQERSRSIADIVAECRELVARGAKEVTLLGQIVTSYGKREIGVKDGKSAFVQLLEAVHEIEGLERIRFTSPHPKGYGDDLVEAYRQLPKLCESAHLPVQSGSDRVLKLMHRGYTRARFLGIVEKLRRVQPKIGLGTDIIAGFPGETEEDFEETLSLAREVRFDQAYVFKYSQRRDTPAAAMPNQLPQTIIEDRHAELLKVINEIAAEKFQSLVGQRVQILVEGTSRKNPARMEGRTRCNRIVVFEGSARHCGQLLDLQIRRASAHTLYGDPAIIGLE
ncbi:MAG: tRNA (N6-isopentenyl adenosine(37)-C2)-methylthiotransferase MiaB [Verrucomicrobia bacterium]|nr:tRNA (N6-isopentenyl adenosine(37)-C2)-methylthiotransferase MiaB [Verrucomicrobiota bacterium]